MISVIKKVQLTIPYGRLFFSWVDIWVVVLFAGVAWWAWQLAWVGLMKY